MPENQKPNYYTYKHRGTVPGDVHSCCHHTFVIMLGAEPDVVTVKFKPK